MCSIDPQFLLKYNRSAPRYTSYPTAPEWSTVSPKDYTNRLAALSDSTDPLSLYLHIPFCKTMCLYCGCSVVLNRKAENESRYVDYLCKEIQLVGGFLGKKKRVAQLHFGGGTPTKLSMSVLHQLFKTLDQTFDIAFDQEISIEIDPRTVVEDEGEKLKCLRQMGFNRVSFGVQDTNEQVQEAVKRYQSLEMTQATFLHARQLGFKGINIDLIYGLPYQTVQTFKETTEHILEMRPDRISLFSYAKIPWLKPHQKAIKESTLPSTEEKFAIYLNARNQFISNGYTAIGMDHFAACNDELSSAYKTKKLQRNFQGYSLKLAEEMLSFGISSIGFTQGMYIQNLKELATYYEALDRKELPVYRGKILSEDDLIRKWTIHTLMCDFEIDKSLFSTLFRQSFDHYFLESQAQLSALEQEGLLLNNPEKIRVTPLGELFVRIIAMAFDAYQQKASSQPKFSQSI